MKEIISNLNEEDKDLMGKYLEAGQIKFKYARKRRITGCSHEGATGARSVGRFAPSLRKNVANTRNVM
jgi:hypothetical protein